jgi:hypothetical protein
MDWSGILGGTIPTLIGAAAVAGPYWYGRRRRRKQLLAMEKPGASIAAALLHSGLNMEEAQAVMVAYNDSNRDAFRHWVKHEFRA